MYYRAFVYKRGKWRPVYIGVLRHSFRMGIFTTRKWHNYGCKMGMKDINKAFRWSKKVGYQFRYMKVG